MEPSAQMDKKTGSNKLVLGIAGAVTVTAIAISAAVIVKTQNNQPVQTEDGRIAYSTEAKVMLDQDSLQAAMDEAVANAKDGNVALRYKNNAYSSDGKTFECSLMNSQRNKYDCFFTIYSDAELTDQLYLTGLVPPGSGFEEITLDKELSAGDHHVYIALTQVADEEGEQVIKNQVVYTMEFHVMKA